MTDLQPGRELDALIAVMMGDISGPIVEIVGGKAINAAGDSVILQPYSTDITAAWRVAEKVLRELGKNGKRGGMNVGRFDLTVTSCEGYDDNHFAKFRANTPRRVKFHASGKTAAHAICLAALKAVGAIE